MKPLKLYEINGQKKTAKEWMSELGITADCFYTRFSRYKAGDDRVLHKGRISTAGKNSVLWKHGETSEGKTSRIYRAWHHLKDQGNAGICTEWCKDFIAFRDWAMRNGWNDEAGYIHLVRINKHSIWSPENTYVSPIVSGHRVYVTHNNITMCLNDWARTFGVSKQMLRARLIREPVDKAFEDLKPIDEPTLDVAI